MIKEYIAEIQKGWLWLIMVNNQGYYVIMKALSKDSDEDDN